MDKEQMMKKLNDEDYIIRVRPFLDEEDVWSGEIDLSIITLSMSAKTFSMVSRYIRSCVTCFAFLYSL